MIPRMVTVSPMPTFDVLKLADVSWKLKVSPVSTPVLASVTAAVVLAL